MSVSSEAKDLISRLLSPKPADRPTAAAALQHPWFASMPVARSVSLVPEILSKQILERVCHFAHENAVRKAAAALVLYRHGLPTHDNVEQLEVQFAALDGNGNGTVSAAELVKALEETLHIPKDEGELIFSRLDFDGDATIKRSEFLAACTGASLLCCSEAIWEVFQTFDINQDGKIELEELQSVLGHHFCGKDTRILFDELDKDGSGAIDLDEFTAAAAQTASPSNLRL